MPQPLSMVRTDATIIAANAGQRVLAQRPGLAVLAMEAISSWSNVEVFMLKLFVNLFGGDHTLAARMYLKLDGRGPKSAVLGVAIDRLKDEKLRNAFKAIIGISATRQGQRDALAHRIWGYSPELPDALLLLDPLEIMGNAGPDRENVFVYKAADFKDLIAANDRLCGYCMDLLSVLLSHPANEGGKLLERLCTQTEVQEKLPRPPQPA